MYSAACAAKPGNPVLKRVMTSKNRPSLLPDDKPRKRRQQFLYDSLYENVKAKLIAGISACIENVSQKKDAPHPGYLCDAQRSVYQEMFRLWMLEYTAGGDLDELANEFKPVVDQFVHWNELNVPYRIFLQEEYKDHGDTDLTVCAVNFDNQIEYENALQLLSVAIMIRDGRSIKRIIASMSSNRRQDALYEQLILDYVNDPQELMEESLHEKPYATLLEAYFQEDNNAATASVQAYLKQWYRYQDGARWYDAHKKIRNDYAFYYGYWAFEAGATCYLLDIDDSSIDHMVYPKDLVAYARKLRKENRVTSDFNAPLGLDEYPLSRLRCESGQPCPQTGWWLTPARANSRHLFKQGDIMPAFEESSYGATIWQWDIDQSDSKL